MLTHWLPSWPVKVPVVYSSLVQQMVLPDHLLTTVGQYNVTHKNAKDLNRIQLLLAVFSCYFVASVHETGLMFRWLSTQTSPRVVSFQRTFTG